MAGSRKSLPRRRNGQNDWRRPPAGSQPRSAVFGATTLLSSLKQQSSLWSQGVFLGVFLRKMNTLTSTAEKMPSETHDVVLVYVATVFLCYHKAGSWSSKSVGASRLRRNKYLIAFTCASVLLAWLSPKQLAFAEHISVLSVFSLPPVCWTMWQPTAHFYLSLKQLSF